MQAFTVTRVLVWSRWLRLSHWTLALSTIGLLVTGWLLDADPLLALDARDYHYMFSALLLPALLLRLYLLFFGKATDHLNDCEPDRHRLSQAMGVLKYYLSLGRIPLPKWFSHNPLWGPLYLLLFFALTLSSISGLLLLNEMAFIANLSSLDLHQLSHHAIGLFVLLHIAAVFSHDLGSDGSDISGMISGYRTFNVDSRSKPGPVDIQAVSLDELMKSLK